MRIVQGTVVIRKPSNVCADYVTTPATWPQWYPLTRSVEGPVNSTPAVGVAWTEKVRIVGLPFTFTWTTVEDARPNRYVYHGSSNFGGHATITYVWKSEGEGTRWDRLLEYEQDRWYTRLADWLFLAAVIRSASARAVLLAKERLEALPGN